MSLTLPNDNSCCAFRPPFPKPERDQNQLERFLDKIDTNDDGKFSRKEISEAADADNDGFVSKSEKAEMLEQIHDYIKDAAKDGTWNMKSLGQAQEVINFLEESAIPIHELPKPKHATGLEFDPKHGNKLKPTPRDKDGNLILPKVGISPVGKMEVPDGLVLPRDKDGNEIPLKFIPNQRPPEYVIQPEPLNSIQPLVQPPVDTQPVPWPVDENGNEIPMEDLLTPAFGELPLGDTSMKVQPPEGVWPVDKNGKPVPPVIMPEPNVYGNPLHNYQNEKLQKSIHDGKKAMDKQSD